MTDQKLRIGVIGIGWYAGTALIPQLRATGRAEIVAIARRNADRLALAQQALSVGEAYTDWRELLDKSNLDAVVSAPRPIPTPSQPWPHWNGDCTSLWKSRWR